MVPSDALAVPDRPPAWGPVTQRSRIISSKEDYRAWCQADLKGAGLTRWHFGLAIRYPTLHFLQRLRDEAHRFAISGHRARRAKKRSTSALEGIAGVGPKRRRELLRHFGGWQQREKATLDQLMKVDGISGKIARDIYAAMHGERE